MQGMTNFSIKDEAFFNMTWSKAPEIKVLATATMAATPSAKGHEGEVVPQIWTYEKSLAPAPTGLPYRAFVWMQGHNYANFALPQRPVDAAARDRVGRQAPGGLADDRAAAAWGRPRPWHQSGGWRRGPGQPRRAVNESISS